MNHQRAVRALFAILTCILWAPGVRAQHIETRVENANVVYVEGNDVVVKFANGDMRLFEIPDSSRFAIDGKYVNVRGLKPGMKLTALITTANAPRWVDTVEIIEVGTVWRTAGSGLVIKSPDGENKLYRVPSGTTITIDGKDKTLDQLQEGDKITATVVRTSAPADLAKADARILRPPATPPKVGVLLIDEGAKLVEPPGMWGSPAMIVLVAAILLVAILVLLTLRRKRKA